MSLTIRLTGTGGAQLVPVFGCDCPACRRARVDEAHRRRPCSAVVKFNNAVTLLDAGLPDLMTTVARRQLSAVSAHPLSYGSRSGPVPAALGRGRTYCGIRPPDEQGCDDLFKHPGLLDFSHTVEPL
jgi:phosphoribosyl 1,2-cyclic phosphate phosphodiesterase